MICFPGAGLESVSVPRSVTIISDYVSWIMQAIIDNDSESILIEEFDAFGVAVIKRGKCEPWSTCLI